MSKPGNYPLPLHKQELGATTDDAEQPTMDPLNEESSSAFDEIGIRSIWAASNDSFQDGAHKKIQSANSQEAT